MEVSGSEVVSPPVAQSTLVRHDKKLPSSSLLGPDQLRELQAVVPTWVQVGQDIDGEGEYDWSGRSVAVSEDGSRVAIGAVWNDGNGSGSGQVRVYDYKSSSESWVQVGQDIDGESSGDGSGGSVAMSEDGSRVAIGASGNNDNGSNSGHVRVYDYESSSESWVQVGQDIDGEEASYYDSGVSVAMSDDGSRVAIGTAGNDNDNGISAGQVRVYDYKSSSESWVQVGNDINGEEYGCYNFFGESVAMSDDGSRVAIGAPGNSNDNGFNSGQVRVYDYKSSSESWVQVGNDIDGEARNNYSGGSVAMSDDGSRVAIGAVSNDNDSGSNSGHVRVYDYDSSSESWVQVGNDIDGEASGDKSGGSVAMSDDGSRVAIGAHENNDNGSKSGHVRVYDYESSSESWVQVGQDIDGEGEGDYSGYSVAMSDDGSRVAIGAFWNDNDNGISAGQVRVYTATPSHASCSTYGSESECANVSGPNNCFWFGRLGRCKDCSVLPREFLCVRKGCTWNVDSCE